MFIAFRYYEYKYCVPAYYSTIKPNNVYSIFPFVRSLFAYSCGIATPLHILNNFLRRSFFILTQYVHKNMFSLIDFCANYSCDDVLTKTVLMVRGWLTLFTSWRNYEFNVIHWRLPVMRRSRFSTVSCVYGTLLCPSWPTFNGNICHVGFFKQFNWIGSYLNNAPYNEGFFSLFLFFFLCLYLRTPIRVNLRLLRPATIIERTWTPSWILRVRRHIVPFIYRVCLRSRQLARFRLVG